MTTKAEVRYLTRLATDARDIEAVERLRYEVFVDELGGDGPLVDHRARRERDRFDPHCEHLMLIDPGRAENQGVVGTYRLMTEAGAQAAGGFYSEAEYDLDALLASGRRLLECGRSCLARDHRGGVALHALWSGLARLVLERDIGLLFGVASFAGTDATVHRPAMSLLHHERLAPKAIRPVARKPVFAPSDLPDPALIDRLAAMRAMPPLIKAYLRLGGRVGEGAFVDHAFNTCDVCMVLDTRAIEPRQRARLTP